MAEIKDVVEVVVTKVSATVKTKSFGIPAVIGPNASFAERIQFVSSAAAAALLLTGGIADEEYLHINTIFSQNPAPSLVAIGRTDIGGVDADMTAALLAINAENADWYGFTTVSRLIADQEDAAAFASSNFKFYYLASDEAGIITTGTTDIAAVLNALSIEKAYGLYLTKAATEAGDAAAMAVLSVKDPGTITAKFKKLIGVTYDVLSDTARINIAAKGFNNYIEIGARPMMEEGLSPDLSYADLNIFVDWLRARLGEGVFGFLASQDKVEYSDFGIDSVKGAMLPIFELAQKRGAITAHQFDSDDIRIGGFQINVPLFEDVTNADKAARFLQDVTFECFYSNAIHKVKITGTIAL